MFLYFIVGALFIVRIFPLSLSAQEDITCDFLDEKMIFEKQIAPDDAKIAEAFAKFADVSLAIMEKGTVSDADAARLLNVLEIDPNARLPLAILMAEWIEKNQPQKLLDNLLPILNKNPHVDSLALAAALAFARLELKDKSIELLERTLDAIETLGDYEYGVNYAELVIHLAELYAWKDELRRAEELFDRALSKDNLKNNFKLRRAAFIFFSNKAEDRSFSLFSGWLERRFYRKMMECFSVLEKIWLDELVDKNNSASNSPQIKTSELTPMLMACKKFNLVDRLENLILEKLLDDQRNIEARIILAALCSETGRFANSSKLWKRLCEENKSNYLFHNEYGRMALSARNFTEAIRALEWAEFISPPQQKEASSYWAAIAYMNARNYEKAISKFEKLKNMPEAYYFRAVILRKLGDNIGAAKILDEAEKIANEKQNSDFLSQDFYMYMAFINDRAKRYDRALEILKKLYKDYPDEHEICNFLGYFLADRNMELDLAKEAIDKAIKAEPDNGAYLDSVAWLYYRKKDFDNAYKYIMLSLEKTKDSPDSVVHDHAGDILYEIGKIEEAIAHWKIASELFSEDTDPCVIQKKIEDAKKLSRN